MIRRFILTNALKETADLNDSNLFAVEPEGLGVQVSNAYIDLGSERIRAAGTAVPGSLTVQVLFGAEMGNSYQQYADFIRFLTHEPYVLTYETDAGTHQRDCVLSELTKSEIGQWGVLDEGLTLDYLGPWYRWVALTSRREQQQEFEPGMYGKTYAVPQASDPAKVELIADPEISSFDSVVIAESHLQYVRLSELEQYLSGYNTLIVSGINMSAGIAIAFSSSSASGACKFELYYKTDLIDGNNGEFVVSGKATVYLDGYDITGKCDVGAMTTTVFLPAATSVNWHRITMLFLEPVSALIYPRNRKGFTYYTCPSLYDVVIHSGREGRYVYDPYYVYGNSTAIDLNQINVFNIDNQSQVIGQASSPAIVRISRAAHNPSWRLLKGGQVIQSDGYFVDVLESEVLEVSSVVDGQHAIVIQPDGSYRNVYQYQDMTASNFVTFPQGSTTLIFDGVDEGDIDILYKEVLSVV